LDSLIHVDGLHIDLRPECADKGFFRALLMDCLTDPDPEATAPFKIAITALGKGRT